MLRRHDRPEVRQAKIAGILLQQREHHKGVSTFLLILVSAIYMWTTIQGLRGNCNTFQSLKTLYVLKKTTLAFR